MKRSLRLAMFMLAAMPACANADPAVPDLAMGAGAAAAQAAIMVLTSRDNHYIAATGTELSAGGAAGTGRFAAVAAGGVGISAGGPTGSSGAIVFVSNRPGTRPVIGAGDPGDSSESEGITIEGGDQLLNNGSVGVVFVGTSTSVLPTDFFLTCISTTLAMTSGGMGTVSTTP